MKTGLNRIEMRIQITALRESIIFFLMFPENSRGLPDYSLLRYVFFSVYDVIHVVQVCFDVNVIMFVSTYFFNRLSVLLKCIYVQKISYAHACADIFYSSMQT